MADFRKMLYAFALVALLVGMSAPASAQLMSCGGTAVNPIMRAEGYAELMGDIIVTCTGGVPTTVGLAVPAVTVTVFTNATITSKVTSTAFTPNFNEALLIMDEPNTSFNNGLDPVFNHPVLGCGSGVSTYTLTVTGQPNTGVCETLSTGAPGATYDGNNTTAAAARPNVYQGRQVATTNQTAVQFIGVPIDPPGPGRLRIIRITNVRINGVGVTGGSISGSGFNTGIVQATVSFTTPNSVATQAINVTTGTFRNGFAGVTGRTVTTPWPQCNPGTDGGDVIIAEGFPSAFKPKNWVNMENNGTYVGTQDWRYDLTTIIGNPDLNQNVPGVYFSTESGFEFIGTPALSDPSESGNPPQGISTAPGSANPASIVFTQSAGQNTGLIQAGSVSQGTRFAVRFANIPIGSNASVPAAALLRNAAGGVTGVAVRVTGHDAAGAGGSMTTTGLTLGEGAGPFMAVYEVLFSNAVSIETLLIHVTLAPTVDLGANPPVNGSPQIGVIAQATAGFAPFYSSGSNAGNPLTLNPTLTASSGPIPRFIDSFQPTPPVNLFSFTKCACDLLFPWVVGDANFFTSIVIANTSRDPGSNFNFFANPETGRVRFWYYGTNGIDVSGAPGTVVPAAGMVGRPSQISNILTQPGSYLVHVVSPSSLGDTPTNGLTKIAGNFAGYVIAQAEFRYCHGVASLGSFNPGSGFGVQTYIGLVMDGFAGELLPARTGNLGENFVH